MKIVVFHYTGLPKNVLCLILFFFIYIYLAAFECNTTSDWIKPYGLANQNLCYVKIYEILEKKTENILENG